MAKSVQVIGVDGSCARAQPAAARCQMRELGVEVVRAAGQFQAEGTCDCADSRQFAQAGGEHDARAGSAAPDRGLRPSPGALVSGRPPRTPGPAAPWS
jgi:hypothetical protein